MWSCAHGAECCFIVGLTELFKTFGRIFLICKDISLIDRIKLLLLLKNTAKVITREVIPSTTGSFIFYYGALLQFESSELAA